MEMFQRLRRVRDNCFMVRPERRDFLAGERPVRVSAGAPGSRPQSRRSQRMEKWTHERFVGMSLYQLRGSVKYPAQATSVRSSLSRVRENRMHGLKGEA